MQLKPARRHPILYVLLASLAILTVVLLSMGFIGNAPKAVPPVHYRAAVGAQQPRRVIVLDGVSIAYTDSEGTGPVLICLHAIGHGARDFEDLSRRLSPEYRVIAIDFPNQGNSGPDPRPPSGTRYAELLSQFIERLNLDSVTLLGNSIGGAAAIRYTGLHPERVSALVLCDSGGLGEPSKASKLFIGIFVQFFAAGRRGAFWYPWAFERYYRKVLLNETAREERERIVRSAYEIAPTLEHAWRSFARPEENLRPLLAQIQCPVLLAWAKNDFVIPLKYSSSSFALFPHHHLETFEGGHAAFLEDPDRFEQSLRRFLDTVNPRSQ